MMKPEKTKKPTIPEIASPGFWRANEWMGGKEQVPDPDNAQENCDNGRTRSAIPCREDDSQPDSVVGVSKKKRKSTICLAVFWAIEKSRGSFTHARWVMAVALSTTNPAYDAPSFADETDSYSR
jgi:hypothetical protein